MMVAKQQRFYYCLVWEVPGHDGVLTHHRAHHLALTVTTRSDALLHPGLAQTVTVIWLQKLKAIYTIYIQKRVAANIESNE